MPTIFRSCLANGQAISMAMTFTSTNHGTMVEKIIVILLSRLSNWNGDQPASISKEYKTTSDPVIGIPIRSNGNIELN